MCSLACGDTLWRGRKGLCWKRPKVRLSSLCWDGEVKRLQTNTRGHSGGRGALSQRMTSDIWPSLLWVRGGTLTQRRLKWGLQVFVRVSAWFQDFHNSNELELWAHLRLNYSTLCAHTHTHALALTQSLTVATHMLTRCTSTCICSCLHNIHWYKRAVMNHVREASFMTNHRPSADNTRYKDYKLLTPFQLR